MVVVLIRRCVRKGKENEFLEEYKSQKPKGPNFIDETLTKLNTSSDLPESMRSFPIEGVDCVTYLNIARWKSVEAFQKNLKPQTMHNSEIENSDRQRAVLDVVDLGSSGEGLRNLSTDDYEKAFSSQVSPKESPESCSEITDEKRALALEKALDIRKFEIELYWKRATYFWTLIAATFAGFFLILGADESKIPAKSTFAFVMACVGFSFTFAWYLAIRGSKRWQENWEGHVDLLEDKVLGPLYKTLVRADSRSSSWLTGSGTFSVTKINQLVSLYVLVIWIVLAIHAKLPLRVDLPIDWTSVVMGIATPFFCALLYTYGNTSPSKQKFTVSQREVSI